MLTTHYDREQMEEIQKAARELREDANVGALLRRLIDQYGNIALSVDRHQARAYLVEPHIYPPEFSYGPNALAALTALEQALGQRKAFQYMHDGDAIPAELVKFIPEKVLQEGGWIGEPDGSVRRIV